MKCKKRILALLMLVIVIFCSEPIISASAKSAPRLSVSNTITFTKKGRKTVRLKGAGKAKVRWIVREDDYCKKYKKPSVRVVRKNNNKIVLETVHNGVGSIICKVGKKTISLEYDVFLRDETLNKSRHFSNEKLFKKFLDGELPAIYDDTNNSEWVYIQTLKKQVDSGTISLDEKTDLDNDGENEYIIGKYCGGLYGGIYLDAHAGELRILASGEGTASVISYTSFQNATWIVHSDLIHSGRQEYTLKKYNGDGKVTETISLGAEYNNSVVGTYNADSSFHYNDKNISMTEYETYLRDFHLIGQ